MVAETAEVPSAKGDQDQGKADPASIGAGKKANRGGIRRLIASIVRVVDIQFKIWLIEAKISLIRVGLYIALFGAAAVFATVGIVFFFIGLFRVLTDVAGIAPVWAFLIFAGFFFILAGTLVLVGRGILRKNAGTAGRNTERRGE